MNKKIAQIVILLFYVLVSHGQETIDPIDYKPVEYPENYVANLNVVYVKLKDWEGKADLYLNLKAVKSTPVIINIHGGGWNKGVKESQRGFNPFFESGFAVANMEYRLSQKATAPAAIEDTRCLLIYLIKNAKQLNIDPNKIVIMGGSAGGHLALMGGLLGNDKRFDTNCKSENIIKVAAIINKYGIADVWDWAYGVSKSRSAIQWLGDKSKDKKFADSVSPISYVNKNSPPTFIVHGDADPTVPYQQSVNLYKKYKEAGVKCKFIKVVGGLHGKFDKEKNNEINQDIITFLTQIKVID
jgi:acetyl esterase/lipase